MKMIYIFLFAICTFVMMQKSPRLKGKVGEISVVSKLSRLNKEQYIVLNNILIPKSNGGTAQIDHVVVSVYGIFVIETKNYRGRITGSEYDQYWKQTIYRRKEKFYSPIRQNYGHVKALEFILIEFKCLKFIPIVSFSYKSDLKVAVTSEVIYAAQLLKTIAKYKEIALTKEEIKKIAYKISSANVMNVKMNKAHVENVKEITKRKATQFENVTCPKCGNKLVERNGKYGKFKGCSSYPTCKFTLKNK